MPSTILKTLHTCIISFNLSNNRKRQILSLVPFYRWEKGDAKRLSDLPKYTNLSGRLKPAILIPRPLPSMKCTLLLLLNAILFQRYTLNPTSSSKPRFQFPVTNFSEFPCPLICIIPPSIRDNSYTFFVFPLPPQVPHSFLIPHLPLNSM